MNIHTQTDIWIHRSIIVLGSILAVGAGGAVILAISDQPLPEILIALGVVAAGGFARLLIPSPLK